jgi:hypothetical protein
MKPFLLLLLIVLLTGGCRKTPGDGMDNIAACSPGQIRAKEHVRVIYMEKPDGTRVYLADTATTQDFTNMIAMLSSLADAVKSVPVGVVGVVP